MFCTLLACTCSVATAAVAPSGGWDGGALEEAVVDASCRVATVASAYRAATKAILLRGEGQWRTCGREPQRPGGWPSCR
jgi:hypothetical protein